MSEAMPGTSRTSREKSHGAARCLSNKLVLGGSGGNSNDLYTLWLFNIAMENGPFIDGLPIKNGDFPWLC